MAVPLTVDVYGDVICPWCFIGFVNFEEAVRKTRVEVHVKYHPFLLHPELPQGASVPAINLQTVFGKRAAGAAMEAGIKLADTGYLPNSVLALCLLAYAGQNPKGQSKLVRALYRAQFELGKNLSELDELCTIASHCGLNAIDVRAHLSKPDSVQKVQDATAEARTKGISGVPHYIFNDGQYSLVGGQSVDVFALTLKSMSKRPKL